MRLDAPFRRVRLEVDVGPILAQLADLDPGSWRPHPEGHAGNDALPLVSANGDAADDAVDGQMLPTEVLDRLPALVPVFSALDAPIGRTRLMRIVPGGEATAHVDVNRYWWDRHRVHVPLQTAPSVEFICGDEGLHMPAGAAWIFDTWRQHNVVNPSPAARIHLVVDTVGSTSFTDLLDETAPVRRVATDRTEVEYERAAPAGPMPFEQLAATLEALTGDLGGPASAPGFRSACDELLQAWAAGPDPDSLRRFTAQVDALGSIVLANRTALQRAVRQLVVNPAWRDAQGRQSGAALIAAPSATPSTRGPSVARPPSPVDRPVIIVCPPRSGSSLLFELLASSPNACTIGGESHLLIEGVASLHPAASGFDSNRLDAAAATLEVAATLRRSFVDSLVDRDKVPVAVTEQRGLRMVEKTPKNALRVPFFEAVFPDAHYVHLVREPHESIASLIDSWRSGRFVTYPQLPGWSGLAWSHLLIPGWRDLNGSTLAEIAVRQWAEATSILLDDLQRIPSERLTLVRYADLVEDPQATMSELCRSLGMTWDGRLEPGKLPLSRHTLTAPDPHKWRRHWPEIEPLLPTVAPVVERVSVLLRPAPPASSVAQPSATSVARPPATSIAQPMISSVDRPAELVGRPTGTPTDRSDSAGAPVDGFHSVHTAAMPALLERAGISLIVTTYQSGRLIALRHDKGVVNTHFRFLPRPMGVAVAPGRMAVGTQHEVIEYRDQPAVAAKIEPVGSHDACYLVRRRQVTGDVSIHEMAFDVDGELWFVNTRFSCLATLDADHSFVPRWKPAFISQLAAEDRCHLNGLAMVDGRPKFVTAFGATDDARGWRSGKADGGMVIDVDSHEIVVAGLAMPHSPRWHDGRLWVLESGRGALCVVDLATGRRETVVELPGFTRGLAFIGRYALVGLSQVRETVFDGLPLTERDEPRQCGVWIIDTSTARVVGFLRFEGSVGEVFDVQILAARMPEVLELDDDRVRGAFVLPKDPGSHRIRR